jgi:hypothetical protein
LAACSRAPSKAPEWHGACIAADGGEGFARQLCHSGTEAGGGRGILGALGLAKAATTPERDGLAGALREARQAEAAHFEAALELRDSKSLRLQLLKDDLLPLVESSPEAQELFGLALIPGEAPKLWIDLISFIVMEPDHRTYRFLQHRQDRREILFETADRELMAAAIRRHMAHLIVARERQTTAVAPPATTPGYTSSSLILAWASGFAFGALALLGLAIYFGLLKR